MSKEQQPLQYYRFRVFTSDGREIVSPVAAVKLPFPLAHPRWNVSEASSGDTVKLTVEAPQRNDQRVIFAVERNQGGSWLEVGQVVGKVESEKATVDFRLPSIVRPLSWKQAQVVYKDHDPASAAGKEAANQAVAESPSDDDQLRFRAITREGLVAISGPLQLKPAPLAGKLTEPKFGHDKYVTGQMVTMFVNGQGMEGAPIHFHLERKDGEKWAPVGRGEGTMTGGVAKADYRLDAMGMGGGKKSAKKDDKKKEKQKGEIRFTAVGPFSSVVSQPMSVELCDGVLTDPQWSHAHPERGARYQHGESAVMRVKAEGLDGHQVRFRVEKSVKTEWKPYATATTEVTDGEATAEIMLYLLPTNRTPTTKELKDLKTVHFRFHADVVGGAPDSGVVCEEPVPKDETKKKDKEKDKGGHK